MAQAKKETRLRTRVVKVPVVVLELSPEEASTLHAVTRRIAGSTMSSPRGHMDKIGAALSGAVVDYQIEGDLIGRDPTDLMSDDSTLRFRPYKADHSDRRPDKD